MRWRASASSAIERCRRDSASIRTASSPFSTELTMLSARPTPTPSSGWGWRNRPIAAQAMAIAAAPIIKPSKALEKYSALV
jgi:hypothetical protein